MTRIDGTPRFVLLCGCPRSGTTLLAQHFGRALQIALPYETHFVPHFQRFLWTWGDLAKPARQHDLVAAMAAYTRIWIYRGIRARAPDRHAAISLLPVLESAQYLPQGGFPEILGDAYRRYADGLGALYYGDKSASFDPEKLSLYDDSVQNLRVVHLIRDGRDVYRSWQALWFGPRSAAQAAHLWRRHVESRRQWAHSNADRYLEVRYEDFLTDPEQTLARIAAFLEISVPSTNMTADAIGEVLRDEPTHPKLGDVVDPGNIELWRDLPPESVKLFEFVAGDTLEACGYKRSVSIQRSERFGLAMRANLGLVRGLLTKNFYLRRARSLMPLIFRVMQMAGISVDKVARAMVGNRAGPSVE